MHDVLRGATVRSPQVRSPIDACLGSYTPEMSLVIARVVPGGSTAPACSGIVVPVPSTALSVTSCQWVGQGPLVAPRCAPTFIRSLSIGSILPSHNLGRQYWIFYYIRSCQHCPYRASSTASVHVSALVSCHLSISDWNQESIFVWADPIILGAIPFQIQAQ